MGLFAKKKEDLTKKGQMLETKETTPVPPVPQYQDQSKQEIKRQELTVEDLYELIITIQNNQIILNNNLLKMYDLIEKNI